jgi:hypothetical protein
MNVCGLADVIAEACESFFANLDRYSDALDNRRDSHPTADTHREVTARSRAFEQVAQRIKIEGLHQVCIEPGLLSSAAVLR